MSQDLDWIILIRQLQRKLMETQKRQNLLSEFGGDRGHWTGNHMILQVEDCIDCLCILYNDQYRYALCFFV